MKLGVLSVIISVIQDESSTAKQSHGCVNGLTAERESSRQLAIATASKSVLITTITGEHY